ncbi:hypothetical protein L0Y34_02405 [Candidatus Parcubacteria bacterium]|nr:hypothetical protein [Candidatus Parcubacteria bacterium]
MASLPFLEELHTWLGKLHTKSGFILSGWALIFLFLFAALLFTATGGTQSDYSWSVLFLAAPVWLPIVVGRFTLMRWLQYKRMDFISTGKKFVLLEIRIPRDTLKTPQAMETFLTNIHLGPGESTWHKRYVVGGMRPWWSLELVSLEGVVHMYIWTREDMRRAVETYLYAQYSDVEIIEAADYSRLRDASHAPYKMGAWEYKHGQPDPFPIKTYVDYGLDKPPGRDEEQVNPLAQVLEFLGSAGPGEQVWIQIMIRFTKWEKFRGKKTAKGELFTWKDEAKETIEKMRKEYVNDKGFPNPTPQQKDTMAAIERNISKPGFDVGIRAVYSAPTELFQSNMKGYLSNVFKPLGSETLNNIRSAGLWSDFYADFPWVNVGGKREAEDMHAVLNLYRRRAYFYPPYRGSWMIMSVEELATLFHIPSATIKTSSIPRIPSTTSAAPANVPL